MTADGEPLEVPAAPPEGQVTPAAPGAVMCLYDGSAAALPRLQLAAASAVAAGRRLVVAHVETSSTGFWAAAFTGYGACLGPPERLLGTTSEMAFAAAVEGLLESGTAWDFASCRGTRLRALRELAAAHDVAVVVVDRSRRLARRLSRNRELTILTLEHPAG